MIDIIAISSSTTTATTTSKSATALKSANRFRRRRQLLRNPIYKKGDILFNITIGMEKSSSVIINPSFI